MRSKRLAIWLGAGALCWVAISSVGLADSASAQTSDRPGAKRASTEVSAQNRRRPPRVRVYRQVQTLPPDAVRECQAWYVQEHRPSGTVITPRMQCWWTR